MLTLHYIITLTLIGLFNGQMGTIKGFVYSGDGPSTPQLPLDFSVLDEAEREMPILLVQIDGDDNSDVFFYSCSKLIKRLIPVIFTCSN